MRDASHRPADAPPPLAPPCPSSSALSAKMCRPRRSEISSQTAVPRTLLPYASSPGEKTAMPSLPGTTAMMPPLTPLLAGMPIRYAHWTGEVVHAARVHNAQDVPDVAEGKSPLSSRRVHAAVCQRGCHDRQVLAGDVHRTWPQVEGEGRLDVPREHAVATHEIGRGPVAVRRTNLGFEGVLVRLQAPVSGVKSEGVQYSFERLFCSLRAPYKVSCSERP